MNRAPSVCLDLQFRTFRFYLLAVQHCAECETERSLQQIEFVQLEEVIEILINRSSIFWLILYYQLLFPLAVFVDIL